MYRRVAGFVHSAVAADTRREPAYLQDHLSGLILFITCTPLFRYVCEYVNKVRDTPTTTTPPPPQLYLLVGVQRQISSLTQK